MSKTDLNTEILISIRDEIQRNREELREEIQSVREATQANSAELRNVREEMQALRRQQMESEVRVSTEITAVAGVLIEIRDHLVTQSELKQRVSRCENDIAELKQRVG